MAREIPIYFDSVIIDSPIQKISEDNPNMGRLKVRVFTKYGNRNGSYITDEVAEQLIKSATAKTTPVVGFFDPETQTWASHTGPTLANAYGYVEDFLGWEPFTDTDGISRDYAVFSVILFSDYFEEAKKIIGQNQSMELDPESITGDWALIGEQEYFVYTTAKMLGFCVIGSHEPCFSVSSFFAKNDNIYNSQYEKFSSLLFDLKTRVEEAENTNKGGEQQMNEFENEVVVETSTVEEPQVEETQTEDTSLTFENQQEEENVTSEQDENSINVEELQHNFEELQKSFNELQNSYNEATVRIQELETFQASANEELTALRATNEQLQASVSTYESQMNKIEEERKEKLIEKYEKIIDIEEIKPIKETINNFSYGELESKLAIMFANKQMSDIDTDKVPLLEPQESQFALLMKNYRKK